MAHTSASGGPLRWWPPVEWISFLRREMTRVAGMPGRPLRCMSQLLSTSHTALSLAHRLTPRILAGLLNKGGKLLGPSEQHLQPVI